MKPPAQYVSLAERHWRVWLPRLVAELERTGQLQAKLQEAAELTVTDTAALQQHFLQQGLTAKQAGQRAWELPAADTWSLGVWRKNFRPSSASSGRGSGRRSNWPIAGISVVQDRRGHQPQPPQGPHAASSLPKLQGSPAPVNAVAHRLQFLMGPGFHDLPTNDDDDSIHVPHRGEPVRDDKGSTPTHQ